MITAYVEVAKANGMKLADALAEFGRKEGDAYAKHGVRRVRLIKAEKPEYLVKVRTASGNAFKAYSAGSNLHVDIFELPDGKWDGQGATVFQANQEKAAPVWRDRHPDARLLMRVHKDDLLRIEHEGTVKIMRVVRLEPSARRLRLAAHNETGKLSERHKRADDPFRWIFGQYDRLREWKTEHVRVDELGRIWRVRPEDAARTLQRVS